MIKMFVKILLLSLLMSWGISGVQGQEIILYGDDEYPPYSYVENGIQKGIYSDILRKLDAQLPDYQLTLKALPWKRGLRMLQQGQIAFLYPPYKRPKERPYMDYSLPILHEQLALFCRKDTLLTSASHFPEDFKGLSVGESLGFSMGNKIYKARDLGLIMLSSAKGTLANLERLLSNNLDCYVNDRLSILYELNLLKERGIYNGNEIVETIPLSSEYGYLGVTKKGDKFPYLNDFLKAFNTGIKRLKDKGEIEKIVNSYMKNIKR
jgi:polar amino acid transport system substrate-binding protein